MKKSNTWLWVLGGIGVAALLFAWIGLASGLSFLGAGPYWTQITPQFGCFTNSHQCIKTHDQSSCETSNDLVTDNEDATPNPPYWNPPSVYVAASCPSNLNHIYAITGVGWYIGYNFSSYQTSLNKAYAQALTEFNQQLQYRMSQHNNNCSPQTRMRVGTDFSASTITVGLVQYYWCADPKVFPIESPPLR